MTPELERLLQEAEEHDRKATKGPWHAGWRGDPEEDGKDVAGPLGIVSENRGDLADAVPNPYGHANTWEQVEANMDFIAWTREAVPKLARAVRESEKRARAYDAGMAAATMRAVTAEADLAAASRALVELAEYAGKALCPSPDMSGRWLPPSGKQVQAVVDAALARPGIQAALKRGEGGERG